MTAASLLSVFISACGAKGTESPAADDWAPDEFRQWKLPGSLREISGLALTPDERLLAITDEQAIVYELDYQTGAIIKSFAFGDPIVRGDFEGIAVLENTIWLMTSDGILLAAQEGPDRRKVRYQRFDTGHGDHCELEGLAQDRPAATLILVCKEANSKKNDLMIFEWAITPGGVDHFAMSPFRSDRLPARLTRSASIRQALRSIHSQATECWLLHGSIRWSDWPRTVNSLRL